MYFSSREKAVGESLRKNIRNVSWSFDVEMQMRQSTWFAL